MDDVVVVAVLDACDYLLEKMPRLGLGQLHVHAEVAGRQLQEA